ncbi:MAG: hypothetical protein ACK44N_03360 [Bacteroidota bacterium]|jgi:cell fate (sporulation/competence/biofilm development) regulator YlbF (YheA/YmcA/DUF963 family)
MKLKSISFLFLLASVFFSCTSDSDTPKKVASHFLEAMEKRDYNDAMSCSTRSTQKLLTQLQRLEELTGENDAVKPNKVTIVSEEIQGDKAVVYFKEEGNELQQRISLKRIADEKNNKVWKVDLLKEELQLNRDAGLESNPESNENNKMPV